VTAAAEAVTSAARRLVDAFGANDAGGEHDLAERETIVFRREPAGEWLAVHEHLSPDPDAA
jgi:ketosteroid isomerase-like protein